MRKLLRLMVLISSVIVLLLTMSSMPIAKASEDLIVTVYNVGKADAILIECKDAAILIDAGVNKSGPDLVEQLGHDGIYELDALIVTHFDKDHVGGADSILEAFPIEQVIQPSYQKDSKQYTQYAEALEKAGINPLTIKGDITIDIGGLPCTFIPAQLDYYGEDEENDFSLVMSLTYGETRFLFAGDVENPRLGELLARGDLRHDFLKVPHHGGYEKLSEAFFHAVSPKIAVITSSEDEPEDDVVPYLLEQNGATVYLTRNGTVRVTSDGQNVGAEVVE